MAKGVQKYDKQGRPICEICGKGFDRLITHTRQTHGIPGPEYREVFGFCKSFSFISKRSKEIARERALSHFSTVIEGNLIRGGAKERFKAGHKKCKHKITAQRLILLEQARAIQKERREK